jgi:predicted RNA-binding Zn-ribbon protein involved in translation (DUF1610 family)
VDLLCPSAASKEAQQRIKDGTIDVLSLPGKEDAVGDTVEVMAQSMSEAVNMARGSKDGYLAPKDMQWQTASRNVLKSITSYALLMEVSTELEDIRERVISGYYGRMRAILTADGWDSTSVSSWINNSYATVMLHRTYNQYEGLLKRAASIAHDETWDEAKEFLQYHAKKLAVIRKQNSTRLGLILDNYIYMRDSASASFDSLQYHKVVTKTIRQELAVVKEELAALAAAGHAKTPTKKVKCTKCGSDLHTGSVFKCPMRGRSNTQAKQIAKQAVHLMIDEGVDFSTACSQIMAKLPPDNSKEEPK